MKLIFTLLVMILPFVATAQATKKVMPKKAKVTTPRVSVTREPYLRGIGPFIIGKSFASIINPLKAKWNTNIRAANSAIDIELQSSRESIIELEPTAGGSIFGDSIFNALHCPDSRVFVLPEYLVQINQDGTVRMISNLYLAFYRGVLARIWSYDTEAIQESFQNYYHFIDGIEAQVKSANVVACYDSQSKKNINYPLATTKTTTWQNGDVVAMSYSVIRYKKDAKNCTQSQDGILVIKSLRLDAELLSCEAASKTKP